VPLGILIAIEKYGHCGHVVKKLSGWQDPKIAPSIDAAVAMAKNKIHLIRDFQTSIS